MTGIDPIRLLERMVGIPSVSGEEGELAAFLVRTMDALGFDAHIDAAGNAVGTKEGPRGRDGAEVRELVLLGHMDTVPGVVPRRIEDGRLYGRGSVDAKGPLATFVVACARARVAPGARLVVVGAVEEETSTSKGARFRAELHRPEACLIGEPSGVDAITLGYKGCLRVDYRLEQPGGHGAGPQGAVAERAAAFWQDLLALAHEHDAGREPLFERLLPSLSSIRTDSDGLTDAVAMTVGFRLPPECDTGALRERLTALADGAHLRFYGEEPAWTSPRTTPLARAFVRALREADLKPRLKHKTGTSDMNVLGPVWQCPILAYGPGDSTLDHTPDEHVVLDEYLRAIDVLGAALAHAGFAEPVVAAV